MAKDPRVSVAEDLLCEMGHTGQDLVRFLAGLMVDPVAAREALNAQVEYDWKTATMNPDVASGHYLDEMALRLGIQPRQHEETDDDLRKRVWGNILSPSAASARLERITASFEDRVRRTRR